MYRCNECGFQAPADPIGVAIMQEHLKEHGQVFNEWYVDGDGITRRR